MHKNIQFQSEYFDDQIKTINNSFIEQKIFNNLNSFEIANKRDEEI